LGKFDTRLGRYTLTSRFRYSSAGTGFIIIFLLRLLITAVAAAAAVLIK
jgi:hypothetical protein